MMSETVTTRMSVSSRVAGVLPQLMVGAGVLGALSVGGGGLALADFGACSRGA